MKKRIAFSVLTGLAVWLAAFAVLCPIQTFKIYAPPEAEPKVSLSVADIDGFVDCTVSEDGNIEVNGRDPQILFQVPPMAPRCAAVYVENSGDIGTAELFYAENSKFTAANVAVSPLVSESGAVCFQLQGESFDSVRLDINSSYKLRKIEFYAENPGLAEYTVPVSPLRVIISVLLGLAAAAAALLLDRRTEASQKIADKLRANYKTCGILAAGYLAAGGLAAVIEVLLTRCFTGPDSLGSYFNRSRFLFMWAIAAVITVFVYFRKEAAKHPEKIFLRVVLITGIMMIVTAPLSHNCWDMDSHLRWAVGDSYFGVAYVNRAEAEFTLVHPLSMAREGAAANAEALRELNALSDFLAYKTHPEFSVPHLPSGILIAVSRLLGASFYVQTVCGEMVNLLIYAFVCYFAMRKLPSGKMILACIALFPTNLYIATNYSYDTLVTSFIMLGMAYYISEQQQPDKPISTRDTVIMCGAFVLACLPKLVYAPLILFPLLLRKKCFTKQDYKRYYRICILILLILGAMLLLNVFSQLTGGGDARGGAVSPRQQVRFILTEPLHYAKILIKFLLSYLSVGNMSNYIVHFAHLGVGSGAFVFIIAMFVTALTDKTEHDRFKRGALSEAYAAIVYFGMAAVIATALYVVYTPVRLETVNGCQTRYLIPLLFPLFAYIGNPGVLKLAGKRWYNLAVMLPLIAVLYYNIFDFYIAAAL